MDQTCGTKPPAQSAALPVELGGFLSGGSSRTESSRLLCPEGLPLCRSEGCGASYGGHGTIRYVTAQPEWKGQAGPSSPRWVQKTLGHEHSTLHRGPESRKEERNSGDHARFLFTQQIRTQPPRTAVPPDPGAGHQSWARAAAGLKRPSGHLCSQARRPCLAGLDRLSSAWRCGQRATAWPGGCPPRACSRRTLATTTAAAAPRPPAGWRSRGFYRARHRPCRSVSPE